MAEWTFMTVYGSPLLQGAVGLRADSATARHRIGRDVAREAATAKAMAELEAYRRPSRSATTNRGHRRLLGFSLARRTRVTMPAWSRMVAGRIVVVTRASIGRRQGGGLRNRRSAQSRLLSIADDAPAGGSRRS